MLLKQPEDLPGSEITPKEVFMNRRRFLIGSGVAGGSIAAGAYLIGGDPDAAAGAAKELRGGGQSG